MTILCIRGRHKDMVGDLNHDGEITIADLSRAMWIEDALRKELKYEERSMSGVQ